MEQKTGIIYRAYTNSGMSYVGQTTKSLEERRKKHVSQINDGKIFHIALKYFEFKWEVLEENIPEEKLLERERYWAEYFDVCKNGYNGKSVFCFPRGLTPMKGKQFSEEHKRKIREAILGRHHSEDAKKKMSEAILGRHLSEETKQKIREAILGRHHSEESKRKMSENHAGGPKRGKHHSEETRKKLSKAAKKQWQKIKGEI